MTFLNTLFLKSFFASMIIALSIGRAEACTLSPTAVISSPVNGQSYVTGEPVWFDGSASTANCGFIDQFRWRVINNTTLEEDISWSGSPFNYIFDAPGSYTVELRVRNSVGLYNTTSVQVTIIEAINGGVVVLRYDQYGTTGNLLKATDALGTEINFYYGSNTSSLIQGGFVNGVKDIYITGIERVNPSGTNLAVKATYTAKGLVSELRDENDKKTTFTYDGLNRLKEVKNNSAQLVEDFEYITAFSGTGYSASNSNRIRNRRYDGTTTRQAMSYFDGLGRAVQSQVLDETQTLITASDYDANGRQWKAWKTYPKSGGIGYDPSYATNANTYYSSSGAGPGASNRPFIETLYENNPLDRPLRIHPEGVSTSSQTVRQSYGVETVDGQTLAYTEVMDESGKRTRTWTDGWGRTIRSTAGYGTTDAATTRFEYDELDRLLKVTTHEGRLTHYRYDARGNLAAKTTPDADGSLNGNPVSETGTGSSVDFEYVYDNAGNLRFMRDPNQKGANRYVEHSYDFDGRVVLQRTCFGSLPTSLTATCSSASQSISYIYDDAGVGSGVGFTVNNALGRLTRVTFQGGYYLYSYNSDGQVERMYNKLDGLSGKTIHYFYNRLGEITQVRYQPGASDSHYLWYTYDQPGRLKLVRSNTTTSQVTDADYSYWPAGMIDNEILGSETISYKYDARDRLLDINNVPSFMFPFSARYTYNNNSTINQAQYHQPSSPHTYKRYRYEHTYDNRNQLKSANYKHYFSAIGTWLDPVDYDVTNIRYDRDGNLKSLERQMNGNYVDFEYSHAYGTESNRMEWVVEWNNQESIDLTHDRNGNMTSISGDYDITGASYDWRNLPLVIIKYGPYSYKYDHLGNRTYKSSGTTRYVRGAFGETLAVYSGSTLQYRNILRPDGTVIGRREGSNRLYYHRDHLGSTRAVVNASGTVVETQDYYPFGLQMPGRSMTTGNSAKEKFTSHELDDGLDLYYMVARRYAPEFGRFLSVDPLADIYPSWSPYNYTLNNPLRFTDLTGLCPEDGSAGENQFGPGFCMEAVVVTATRLPATSGAQGFINTASAIAFTATTRSPIPHLRLAGAAALGVLLVADHFVGDVTAGFEMPAESVMQAKSGSKTFDDIWDSARPTDNPDIRQEDGGFEQAEKDFEALNPSGGALIPGLGKWGNLPNGERVVVRKRSTRDGRPTLERQSKTGKVLKKIRYNNN